MAEADFDVEVNLATKNTLGVPAIAEFYAEVTDLRQLHKVLQAARRRGLAAHILGGGSNVILAPEVAGLVVRPALSGRAFARTRSGVEVTLAGGENWHQAVAWTLDQGFYGLENLALIPGTVGAAPVQNIGAYGVELAQKFKRLRAYDRSSGELVDFNRQACEFDYRESFFKQSGRDRYVILEVTFELSEIAELNLSYPALRDATAGATALDSKAVFDAVCKLRSQKLPDPEILPNCGSFFKNPIVSKTDFLTLQHRYPDVAHFDTADLDRIKIAAAWLIDQAGWKGVSRHGVSVHSMQALVLTNPARLPAQNILALATEIQQSVCARFGVQLELEPRMLGFD